MATNNSKKHLYKQKLKKKSIIYLKKKNLEEPSTIALIMGYFCG